MPFDNTPTEITVDTPASLILEAAIKLIEQPEHWCRHTATMFHPDSGMAYCAWGAVGEASGWKNMTQDAYEGFNGAAVALQVTAMTRGYTNIGKLNDDPFVTHAMVLEAMREALEIARVKLP